MRRHPPRAFLFTLFVGCSTILASAARAQSGSEPIARPFNPNFILDNAELTAAGSMSAETIHRFLGDRGGALATYRTRDLDGVEREASEIIWRAAQAYSINPEFLLALLQREQGLVENSHPRERDLDWATGYAVCDGCSTDDPALQPFRGFAIQIDRAAARQRYYLDHPHEFSVRVGAAAIIDGSFVVPANQATANLYIYTPHLTGNRNFSDIWNRYFARHYPDGSLLNERGTDNVWLLADGRLRLVSSRLALLTDLDPRRMIVVSPSDILRYDIGAPIRFPNYSLLRSPGGTVYLLTDDVRRGIASSEVFRGLGYNPDEVIDVTWSELNTYLEGSPITDAGTKPLGELLQDRTTGGVFYVVDGARHAIWSREILNDRFLRYPLTAVDPSRLAAWPLGDPVPFRDGTLISSPGQPTVYVVSRGQKRPIVSAEAFNNLGYQWSNVILTSAEAVSVHPDGPPITG